MNTYYIRHTDDVLISDAFKDRLWDERRIAVHFPFIGAQFGPDYDWSVPATWPEADTQSIDPNDYDKAGRSAVGTLRRIGQDGGYVCAEYAWRSECLVGEVEPGTDVEIVEGTWKESASGGHRVALVKSIQLQRVRIIPLSQQAILLAGRPRRGTVCGWPSVGSLVEDLVEGRRPEPRLGLLSPALQEAMCAEYLRTDEAAADGLPRLAALVLPVGRSLRDLDIVGMTAAGESLVAQVTHYHADAAGWKLDRLDDAAGEGEHAVLFCRCDEPHVERGVTVYPIERAFEQFIETDLGRRWYDATLHLSGFDAP